MNFDYKKEYKELYLPSKKPSIVTIPSMNFVAVRGKGNPNDDSGEFPLAMQILYGISYAIKMSKKTDYSIEGYFDYVVPPLEGLWWQEIDGVPVAGFNGDKAIFAWIALIRLPEFVNKEVFDWAVKKCSEKGKEVDFSKAEFLTYEEGLCVQCMHIGPYEQEHTSIDTMCKYAEEEGFLFDLGGNRFHHEIYIGDPRRTAPEKLKTVLRYPIKRK
ncbi:MAG TPA: transcriptional regulator [Porphyromonadaceae bacterium]|nr:transcriptional regulator [Porphyromonadaceae bacterium]